jgi:AcrR family transcriptional regulator
MSDTAAASSPHAAAARASVVAAALELFAEQGFDQTSVEQIAQAAGVSRSTFFRQFGGKDDVVFTDHELLLERLRHFLAQRHEDPWAAVCEASVLVYTHFAADPELARRRYAVVRGVPALREREIVTVFRYERLFDEYLRASLPGLDPLDAVGFSALVTAIHNHVLRQLLRGPKKVPVSVLRTALDDARRRFGVLPDDDRAPGNDDVVVAVFPRAMPTAEVARRLRERLDD